MGLRDDRLRVDWTGALWRLCALSSASSVYLDV